MKHHLQQLITAALDTLRASGALDCAAPDSIVIEHTRDKSHGDFAANVAMLLAKSARRKPRELAELIVGALPASGKVAKVEIAGPGFINFFMGADAFTAVVGEVLEAGEAYGRSTLGNGKRVQVEFVSANPTGPLHVGHGRGAAYGATVADLLAAVGFQVHREYYVNDAGRQMDILGTSVWLRYLDLCGETIPFPVNGYKGDYVWDIAATLHRDNGDAFRHPAGAVFKDISADEPAGGDKEIHIDELIARAKELLGAGAYRKVFDLGLNTILADIKQDLEEFGVAYEEWYSERTLVESGKVDEAIKRLQAAGHVYEQEGALWFRSTAFGDEKDRVVVRDNGVKTYFASDIAYHMEKLERGFERVIDVWGADHHGYVPRVKAALTAMGDDPSKLDVLLVQFAILYRGGERVQMSTRSGSFVTLRELRDEVGNDAARFFYVLRKCEQHMDFDLDLAKSQSADNPVYYIQYAHARVCSVMRQLGEKGLSYDQAAGLKHLHLLGESHEQELIQALTRYPEVLEAAALNHEPHQLAHYLRELANGLHTYYNAHQFLVDDAGLRDARLALIGAVRQVLRNGLSLLGVSAPETM
ncbi:MAG: arginine--tRNA ligase [Gammaproteobacteria bacterium HGW-Gammaproteobacteria-1]|jgi:arginyl-tRNA synthetase|nr:MAG: arginine--tRNA ligase [Gammaproteobacteria bacterium HGW-Gammaproteobacteria-1]